MTLDRHVAVARRVAAALAGRRRVDLDPFADAVAAACRGDLPAGLPAEVDTVLSAGSDVGLWQPAATRTSTFGDRTLPAFVTLPTARDATDRRRPVDFGLVPSLAWAAGLPLSTAQRRIVESANAWLRDRPDDTPVVPAAERSLEVFDDEKAIATKVGGEKTLWGSGRLGPDVLRYDDAPVVPLPHRVVGDGHRLLVVENEAAFLTCGRLLADGDGHDYRAVAWGQGRSAPKTVTWAVSPHSGLDVSHLDYWGDVDVDGLEIAAATCAAVRSRGVHADLHQPLWERLLAQPPTPSEGAAPGRERVERAAAVLPPFLRDAARRALAQGRIPQERLGYQALRDVPRWWDDTPNVTARAPRHG